MDIRDSSKTQYVGLDKVFLETNLGAPVAKSMASTHKNRGICAIPKKGR